jgi:hypothetical protein
MHGQQNIKKKSYMDTAITYPQYILTFSADEVKC